MELFNYSAFDKLLMIFKSLVCQPELVKGGFIRIVRVRQAQADILLNWKSCHLQKD